ncbi:MAG: aspartate aminotransferase family protein [Hyphomicrobiales bacterium]
MTLQSARQGHVFGRTTKGNLPTAVAGTGCHVVDATGKRYFDGSGGAAVSCLGHGHPVVTEAIKSQLDKIAFAHTGFFTSEPAEELADLLIANAPEKIDRVYFVSGGSEAVEAALKLARQYFIEKGEPNRKHVIARRQSYHGNTLGALAAGGNAWRKKPFAPLLIETRHIAPCYAYRERTADETEFEFGQRVANELEAEILSLEPNNVMAFIAEPVVGATLGAVPAVDGYFKRIREICDQYGVLLILDEVMCGMGRTGSLFACDHDGVAPDILCIAKGLGAGYQPIGAMLCTQEIYNAIEQGSGFFQHGHTYIGHPVACAGSLAVLQTILDENLVARVATMGTKLQSALEATFGQHEHIGDVRGRGLFRGLEIVEDRDSKKPYDPSLGINTKLKKACFEAGLVCYPMGGTVDGVHGDHVLLAPPFILQDEHIDEIVDKLSAGFKGLI